MVTSPVMGNAGGIVPESKPIRKEASGTSRHGSQKELATTRKALSACFTLNQVFNERWIYFTRW
jgi:hypothetical protein